MYTPICLKKPNLRYEFANELHTHLTLQELQTPISTLLKEGSYVSVGNTGENVFVVSVCVDGWRHRNNFKNPVERKQTPQFKNRQKSWIDPSPSGKQAHENDVQCSQPLEECKFKPQWGVTTQLLEWLKYKTPTKPDAARIWGTERLLGPWWTQKMVAHSGEQVGSSF